MLSMADCYFLSFVVSSETGFRQQCQQKSFYSVCSPLLAPVDRFMTRALQASASCHLTAFKLPDPDLIAVQC